MASKVKILFILLVLLGCDKSQYNNVEEDYIHRVRSVEAVSETITPTLHSFGSLSFEHKADKTATVEGTIDQILVEEGDAVYKGQLLMVLKNVQLEIQKEKALTALYTAQTELQLAQSNLLDAELNMKSRFLEAEKNLLELQEQFTQLEIQEKDLEDKQRIFEAGGLTQEAMEKLQRDLDVAYTQYEIAEKNREILLIGLRDEDLIAHGYDVPQDQTERLNLLIHLNTLTIQAKQAVAESRVYTAEQEISSINQLLDELHIRSPIAGVVGARYLEEGERAKEGDKLLTIFNTDNVYVVFPIQESDLRNIHEGQKAFITIDSLGSDTVEGSIHQISPTIDPQSGNIIVKAILNNSDGIMKPGMFSRVDIVYDIPQDIIVIPDSALARKEQNSGVVLVINNGRVLYRDIELGEPREDYYPVMDGLSEGQLLVDSPSPILKEGDQVEIY